jgi:hypothetical protein
MDFQTYAVRELTAVADKLADTAKKQLEATSAQLSANFDATINRLRHDQSELVNENERLTAENAALTWEKDHLTESAKIANRGALIDRLCDVFEQIGSSKTVDDVLLAAGRGLAGDFNRVAVFAGERRLAQLGAETPLLDPAAAGVTAFPIVVRGEKLATILADEETQSAGEGARLAEVVRRHAVLALDRLTIELKAVGELRAYAHMLLDEVEYVFNADTSANATASDRRERLSENLRCARQIYGQRVTLEGPAAASVLDEVLSEMLDAKVETAFGRELAEVATAPPVVSESA